MDTTRLAQAERIVKVMAQAMSPFGGEARTAATMAKELMEKYGFTKHELKFSNGFDPNFFEKAWTACEMYWEDATTFESQDTDRPDDDFDYSDMPRPFNPTTKQPFRGKNIDRLYAAAAAKGYRSHEWAGLKQWPRVGRRVKKGEHATKVWLFDIETATNPQTGETEERRHYFRVNEFNRDQTRDIRS